MKNFKIISVALMCVFFCSSSFAWKLAMNKNGIKVYTTKKPEWQYNSFKGETIVNGTLGNVLAFMKDVDNYKNWMWMAEETKMLKEYSINDFVAYGVQSGPGPFKKRDLAVRVKVTQDPKDYSIHAVLLNKPNFLPRNKNMVRVEEIGAKWYFYPLPYSKNKVKVVYEGHANPGGAIGANAPKWIVNIMLNQMPYRTLKNMKKIDMSKYNIQSDVFKYPPESFYKKK